MAPKTSTDKKDRKGTKDSSSSDKKKVADLDDKKGSRVKTSDKAKGKKEKAVEKSIESKRTKTQLKNEKLLRNFADRVKGGVFNAGASIEMLSYFRARAVNQVR